MATNVLILGPLEVVADGTRPKLGGKTQRALLALLALQAVAEAHTVSSRNG